MQIYIAAAITTLITFFVVGGFLKWKSPKEEYSLLLAMLAIELPMAFAAYYLVRLPLVDGLVRLALTKNSGAYGFVTIFYAPLTEEPAKLLPILIPLIYRRINESNAIRAALALGLGFGIGEIWLVASFIAAAPKFANIPWYQFTGFANERFMVCVIHGIFTATALRKLHRNFTLGLLGAMGLHYLGNLPIYLSAINFAGLGTGTWQVILTFYVPVYFILSLMLLAYYSKGNERAGDFLFGKSLCPGCAAEYSTPILGLNWFTKRFEKCSNCRKWHWVAIWKK